jgi:hypothetical protein
LRHHGLIERIPGRLAYRITDLGLRTALFYLHAYDAMVGTGLADISDEIAAAPTPIKAMLAATRKAFHRHLREALGHAA